ncbi:Bacteriophage HK97-gp10, putative tail-component [Bacillus sp. 491mf]|uniref:HK97 gp10 family phage protein n=1 Tax=Bacillus sp. 491mf TaxID=1761755 RepID=UPI0008E12650|nr:HK97 gp10 family phage protein [Bacillus sp. 491mf]SFC02787.1 Bacteriophage HK97-gp10, putative tail-component [Bacillus sp. 491mf]
MVSVSDLANEIVRQVELYTREVEEVVEVSKVEVAKNAVDELRQKSPKLTGDYRKGWRVKKVGNNVVIHNKTNYQLTHLLEKGHAKAGGGRVPAKVHIAPVEERAVNDYLERVERAVQR